MSSYRYKAVDKAGKNTKGVIDADNATQAAKLLRDKGMYPLNVEALGSSPTSKSKEKKSKFSIDFSSLFQQRIPKSTVASTIRQLSTLLNAGLELDESLSTMIDQGGKSPMRSVLSQIRDRIREGSDLAAAFAEYPHVFNPTFITMIKAAESSGTLGIVMERLAEHAEQQLALTRKVQGTLAYPILMFIVGIAVVVFLLAFVIPKVTQIFIDLDRALPTPTQLLLNVSAALRYNWMYIVGGITIFMISIKQFIKTPRGKIMHHTHILRVPILGSLLQMLVIARVCRTLGMLLKNGVSLVKALDIVKNVAGNVVLEKNISDMNKGVQEGKSLAEFMRNSPIFPTSAVQMVAAGEKSGQLSRMLLVVADDCDNQVNAKLQIITSLMEPVMILLLGGMVGFVVMAIILPIFEMSSLVGG
ncbi:type II secretion system F family protein [Halodesulfovibrio sp.]|jgi:general secretion pathway protein F|uniref:type II secretion system F family protein n=1 Tax=Halodesulfovibrio sp. TaxID=1912772 RepID=UPI0025F220D3|nr:type II secretion system F family protein [Halodesulfovibrio sp.]MCT4627381.1 type II secretion system F family protein [Halodesulfovibrio sp.]